jgi:hypothetical protein
MSRFVTISATPANDIRAIRNEYSGGVTLRTIEFAIKPVIGWVAIMIDAVSEPSHPASSCPRKTNEPNPQKPIDPNNQASTMGAPFNRNALRPTFTYTRTIKVLAAVTSGNDVNVNGSTCQSALVMTGNIMRLNTVARDAMLRSSNSDRMPPMALCACQVGSDSQDATSILKSVTRCFWRARERPFLEKFEWLLGATLAVYPDRAEPLVSRRALPDWS